MPSNLKKIDFPYEAMKANELYFNHGMDLPTEGVSHEVVRQVFGRDLMFGVIPKDRPYAFNSLVTSVDGRIAFADQPQGPLIARKNQFAGAGGSLDYWMLNVLRGASDAILVGTKSISIEVNSGGTGHCYDGKIESRREELGLHPVPWRVVVTLDGRDIAFEAAQFTNPEMSTFFYTTAEGVEYIQKNAKKETVVIGPFASVEEISLPDFTYDPSKAYVIVSNEARSFDNKRGMKILREMGVGRLLVESPTVTHIFMQEGLMDELFLNQSGIYVGGQSLAIGQSCSSFTADQHPHTELVSMHMHSPHFLYARYRLIYQ